MEDLRRQIERKIRKKAKEVEDLREAVSEAIARLRTAEAHLAGLEDSLTVFPGEIGASDAPVTLRPGTATSEAYEAIKAAGRPLHISELLGAIQRDDNRENRTALAGSLGAYVRRGRVFTKTMPNTFGIVDLVGGVARPASQAPQDTELAPEQEPEPEPIPDDDGIPL